MSSSTFNNMNDDRAKFFTDDDRMGSSTVNIYPQPVTGELSPEDYVLLQASLKKADKVEKKQLSNKVRIKKYNQDYYQKNKATILANVKANQISKKEKRLYDEAMSQQIPENAMSQQIPEKTNKRRKTSLSSSSNETMRNGGKRKITKRKKSAKRRMTKR